ncbi:hypothetical protein [Helicobacter sp. 23-1045]
MGWICERLRRICDNFTKDIFKVCFALFALILFSIGLHNALLLKNAMQLCYIKMLPKCKILA